MRIDVIKKVFQWIVKTPKLNISNAIERPLKTRLWLNKLDQLLVKISRIQ